MASDPEDWNWTFDPDRSDNGVIVNDVNVDMPEYVPGKRGQLELLFWGLPGEVDIISGGTAGETTGFTAGGANGATAGNIVADDAHIERYKKVREYSFYAGRYSGPDIALDGTAHVTERTPSSASVDSIIVRLTPGPALPHTPGLWVILDDVDDETRFIRDMSRITFDVIFLARESEYADRTALKNAIGSDL